MGFYIVVFILSGIAGIFCRGHYTDVLADYMESGDAGTYMVSNVLDDDFLCRSPGLS